MAVLSTITNVMISLWHIPQHKHGLAAKACKYDVPLKARLLS